MNNETVEDMSAMLSLPEIELRLRHLLDRPCVDDSELGKVLVYDPALSIQLLKIVNSTIYGFPGKIDSLSSAIKIIKSEALENLILTTVSSDTFNKIPSELIDMSCFWHHSVCVGIAAEQLAKRCSLAHPERLFAAGLLHDVGQLIIYHTYPDKALEILEKALPTDEGLYLAEKEVLGFSHGDIGAAFFRSWGLPEIFAEISACHHEPYLSEKFTVETAIVHLANSWVNTLEPSRNITECKNQFDPGALKITGLSEEALALLLSDTEAEFLAVIKIISPDAPLL
jgi:putative nucleotidyltransferase with HDIG domain